uniref:Uncharacterized protein n=1 Tax=Nelumbo nucifera TaxID=4432 RepID=A0A822Y273_NELNU|nr:TPA_asm: hypothetical protein HUJ06_027820 [Nelumbo nucifera]
MQLPNMLLLALQSGSLKSNKPNSHSFSVAF